MLICTISLVCWLRCAVLDDRLVQPRTNITHSRRRDGRDGRRRADGSVGERRWGRRHGREGRGGRRGGGCSSCVQVDVQVVVRSSLPAARLLVRVCREVIVVSEESGCTERQSGPHLVIATVMPVRHARLRLLRSATAADAATATTTPSTATAGLQYVQRSEAAGHIATLGVHGLEAVRGAQQSGCGHHRGLRLLGSAGCDERHCQCDGVDGEVELAQVAVEVADEPLLSNTKATHSTARRECQQEAATGAADYHARPPAEIRVVVQ